MSTVDISPWVQDRIQPSFACRNGQLVSAQFQAQLAQLTNQLAYLRPKEYASFSNTLPLLGNVAWRFAGHTSPMCGAIIARVHFGKVNPGGDQVIPIAVLTITDVDGNVLTTGQTFAGYANGQTINDVPDEWTTQSIMIDASSFPNKQIFGSLTTPQNPSSSARIVGATVYEYPFPPDTDFGYVPQGYSIGRGIYEEDRYDIARMAVDMWMRQAAPLFAWSSNTDATAPSQLQSIYRNVIDTSPATAQSDSSPGFWVDLRYRNTETRSTVPCVFAVHTMSENATPCDVRLIDSSGNAIVTMNVGHVDKLWDWQECDLPPTLAKYDLQMRSGNGFDRITVFASTLYQGFEDPP